MNREEREEAINIISQMIKDEEGFLSDNTVKAHKIALEALEQEPCEDAIDRAEAIKIASGYCHPANVAKELAKMPPVTPQPKTGHWISQELIPNKIKNENVKLCKELKKARKEKKRWKKKYIELRDGKKSIELARIEDGLGLEPILYR